VAFRNETVAKILKGDRLSPLFEQNGISFAFLFGSTVDSETPGDVDIAVLFKNYSFDAYLNTYEELRKFLQAKELDLVVLNRSNARVKLEALLKGILLFADGESLSDFAINTLFEYEDYCFFKKEYVSLFQKRGLEGLSMAERKLDRERMETHLSRLDEVVAQLSRLRRRFSTFEDFNGDIDTRELCVHYLRIALESVIDICRHFLAVRGVSLTEIDTSNIIELSGEKGLIEYSFARKIRGMAGMRNAIVHIYWRLDYEAVYRAVTRELVDFDEFTRQVQSYLKNSEAIRQ